MNNSLDVVIPIAGSGDAVAQGNESQASHIGLSVLMPCHNEVSSVRQNVEEALRILRSRCDRPFEIVVIDDGSTDGTLGRIRDLARAYPEVHVVRLPENGGKGNAIRTAFPASTGALVCFLDGDLDIHPSHVVPFIRILEERNVDIVVGSKRHPESRIDYPIERRVLSFAYQVFVQTLFGLRLRDSQAGIKLFRRDVLEKVFTRSLVKRYAYDAELLVLARRLGYRIEEAAITMNFRDKFGSGVDLKAIMRMFQDTLGIFYRLRITRYYDRTGDSVERME